MIYRPKCWLVVGGGWAVVTRKSIDRSNIISKYRWPIVIQAVAAASASAPPPQVSLAGHLTRMCLSGGPH